MKNACILWVEGRRAESPSFIPSVRKKGFYVDVVPTGTAALDRLSGISPDLAIINAASMRTSGKRICRSLRGSMDNLPIILITSPERPAQDESNAVAGTGELLGKANLNALRPAPHEIREDDRDVPPRIVKR